MRSRLLFKAKLILFFAAPALGLFLLKFVFISNSLFLTVAFPFGQLDKQVLVHPHNLENMQRYYFIENLGLGLVRDSVESLQEYSPGLAASWAQVSEFEWAFELQKNLKWSDGSALTAKEIAQNLENLSRSNSRHVTILRKLKDIKIEDGRLSLIFTQPTNSSLLHELSLADAVIFKDPVEWKVTTGGYYLDKRDDQNIYLKKIPILWGPPTTPILCDSCAFRPMKTARTFWPKRSTSSCCPTLHFTSGTRTSTLIRIRS